MNPPKDGSKPNLALAIPSSPVERVERRLPDGRWVDARAYQDALAKLSDEDALTTAQADADGADAGARRDHDPDLPRGLGPRADRSR